MDNIASKNEYEQSKSFYLLFFDTMDEEKTMEVVIEGEDVISDEDLLQFIFDDNQLMYYNEYENALLDNF